MPIGARQFQRSIAMILISAGAETITHILARLLADPKTINNLDRGGSIPSPDRTNRLPRLDVADTSFKPTARGSGMFALLIKPSARLTHSVVLCALALPLSSSASADAGAADAGAIAKGLDLATNGNAAGVPACSACHGTNGEGQPAAGIPRIAHLDATYLRDQLAAFETGTRANAMMTPIAKTMTPDVMAQTSAYYASLAAPASHAPATSNAQKILDGEQIASRGDWNANIPPCSSCHGLDGLGVGTAFPPIAGQSATYISNQLQAWKSGTRHDDPLGLMRMVAGRLDARQVAAVAAYYETLPAAKPGKQESVR